MTPDDPFEGPLQSLAGHARRTGRLAEVADIRRRGDARRRHRQVTGAAVGVVTAGLLAAGFVMGRPDPGPRTGPPAAPAAPAVTSPSPSAPPSSAPRPSPGPSSASASGSSAPTAATVPLLLAQRKVSIVRVQTSGSVVSLGDDGRVGEADDGSGRQSFVLSSVDGGEHLIRTAPDGSDRVVLCWRATSNGSDPLTVTGAACSAADKRQRFTVTPLGGSGSRPTYAIATQGAYLQYSAKWGLILQETGDAVLSTAFHLVDNGAAPTTAG